MTEGGPSAFDEVLHSARVACWASLEGGPSEEFGALLTDPKSEDPVLRQSSRIVAAGSIYLVGHLLSRLPAN